MARCHVVIYDYCSYNIYITSQIFHFNNLLRMLSLKPTLENLFWPLRPLLPENSRRVILDINMPLEQEEAGPIHKRSFYYDVELNRYLDTLLPPPNFQIFQFGTVELSLEAGLKTTWSEFNASPLAHHVNIPHSIQFWQSPLPFLLSLFLLPPFSFPTISDSSPSKFYLWCPDGDVPMWYTHS